MIKKVKQDGLNNSLEAYKTTITELINNNSGLSVANIALEKKNFQLEETIKSLERDQTKYASDSLKSNELLKSQFESFVNTLLDKESKKINENNFKSLSLILSPLNEKMKNFQESIVQYNFANAERAARMQTEIKNLLDLSTKTSKEANNLAEAIRGGNKLQGLWGEMVLESVLERSGLQKNREYVVQHTLRDEFGKNYRPDVIINLPEGKSIVVDSKVSLLNYERFYNAESQEIQEGETQAHICSVKNHIKELAAKNYQNLYKIKSLDFVLLFIPIESAFSLVMQKDHTLFSYAYSKNIILVSPSTLLATLKTIASIWSDEYRNLYAQEIARQSGEMYNKFVLFLEELKKIGIKLTQANDSFESAMRKLSSGNGNLIKRAERIKDLGAKATKAIDTEELLKYEINE